MTLYTATFADHIITRNSDREYTHAWIVTLDGKITDKGFAGSEALARKAAAATLPKHISDRSKQLSRRIHKRLAQDKGMTLAAWYEEAAQRTNDAITARRIEVAAVN